MEAFDAGGAPADEIGETVGMETGDARPGGEAGDRPHRLAGDDEIGAVAQGHRRDRPDRAARAGAPAQAAAVAGGGIDDRRAPGAAVGIDEG